MPAGDSLGLRGMQFVSLELDQRPAWGGRRTSRGASRYRSERTEVEVVRNRPAFRAGESQSRSGIHISTPPSPVSGSKRSS